MTRTRFVFHVAGWWWSNARDALCRRTLCPLGLHRWSDGGVSPRPTCSLCPRGGRR